MVDVFKNMTLHNIFHCIFSGINTSKYFLILLPKHDWTRVWGHAFSGVKTSLILQGEHTPDSLAHTWLYTLSSFSPTTLKYLTLPQLLMSILTCVAAYCCQVLINFFVKSCTAQNHFAALILILSYRTAGHPWKEPASMATRKWLSFFWGLGPILTYRTMWVHGVHIVQIVVVHVCLASNETS